MKYALGVRDESLLDRIEAALSIALSRRRGMDVYDTYISICYRMGAGTGDPTYLYVKADRTAKIDAILDEFAKGARDG